MKQLDRTAITRAWQHAVKNGKLPENAPVAIFYSREILQERLQLLRTSFPPKTLHAIAIKAQASPEVLRHIAQQGFGLEAASFEEVLLASAAGTPNERIVFDSPVKTREEIANCHRNFPGIIVNANCLEELERYPANFSGRLGLRINPLVRSDAPGMFDVSQAGSKFGVPLNLEDQIIEALMNHPQVEGLHVHVGSGIRDFSANVAAVERTVALADKVNERRAETGLETRIRYIDIGGGIDFAEGGVAAYVSELKARTGLFGAFEVITEFGKFAHTDAGAVVSDIEYIVDQGNGRSTAFIHAGADLFVRKVYSDLPIDYPLSVLKSGEDTEGDTAFYDIAGPLCFAGDYLYRNIELPRLSAGDRLVIGKAGANTLSMWSAHCNRRIPPFIFF